MLIYKGVEGIKIYYFDSNNAEFLHVGNENSYANALAYVTVLTLYIQLEETNKEIKKKVKQKNAKILSDAHNDTRKVIELIYKVS